MTNPTDISPLLTWMGETLVWGSWGMRVLYHWQLAYGPWPGLFGICFTRHDT